MGNEKGLEIAGRFHGNVGPVGIDDEIRQALSSRALWARARKRQIWECSSAVSIAEIQFVQIGLGSEVFVASASAPDDEDVPAHCSASRDQRTLLWGVTSEMSEDMADHVSGSGTLRGACAPLEHFHQVGLGTWGLLSPQANKKGSVSASPEQGSICFSPGSVKLPPERPGEPRLAAGGAKQGRP
jgi:hypothetical protein